MSCKTNIGKRIKDLRLRQNLSQEELAKKLGYKSRSTINKIELGINDVSQTTIMKLSDVLNTTPGYLMGWTEDNNLENQHQNPRPEAYCLNNDEKFVIDTMRKLNEYEKAIVIKFIDSLRPEAEGEVKIFRAAHSKENHPGEVTKLTKEEQERIRKATKMTSKNSNL